MVKVELTPTPDILRKGSVSTPSTGPNELLAGLKRGKLPNFTPPDLTVEDELASLRIINALNELDTRKTGK